MRRGMLSIAALIAILAVPAAQAQTADQINAALKAAHDKYKNL